ncbi:hypothetical protein SCYAM73S_06206 [Streptomyces cyaneofuscatus]
MPAVSSHAFDQVFRSRPEVFSSAPSRSERRVLPKACALKYACTPWKNASLPTYATSCLRTEAPLAYVMPSKLTRTSSRSPMSAMIGCVEGSWSCRYAQVFMELANVVHECGHFEPSASAWQAIEV